MTEPKIYDFFYSVLLIFIDLSTLTSQYPFNFAYPSK